MKTPLCCRCKKRPAVVFVQRMENGEARQEGYCLSCASELKIGPVDELMKRFGITEQDLERMEEQMSGFIEEAGEGGFPFAAMLGQDEPAEEEADGFTPGRSATFPFGFGARADKDPKKEKKDKKEERRPKRKFLDNYCDNLTGKAKAGRLDAVIGRDKEIYRTIQILCRRQKNNPCLIGEAGVGKTAIAEGIALRIAAGQVPARLQNKEIYLLDLTALVAGTQFRGQFEQRVKGLISEVKADGNIILFIDEVHNITGAGDSEGAMNAANILKPALSRGEVQVIGATTFGEYRKFIEKDQALERRFQPVKVEEPSIADTIAVMQGIRGYYEQYHAVRVPPEVLNAAVSLSERYITDRYLPDKAIDLLDEACACCNLRHPELTRCQQLKSRLEAAEAEETALAQTPADEPVDYERMAAVKTELARLRDELPAAEAAAADVAVTMDDVAKVIELWTGIPAVKIKESEYTKLLGLEAALKAKIIGQDEAVEAVARAIKRSRADLSGRRRPASFIFVGPTGVGKTELVKVLAEQLFSTPETLLRYDMSEFMEKHSVSRLIGAPPGYVGYDEAGQLTEKVRRKPYSVVLFDEIEKAHPDVLNVLLQILDDGRVTDAQGRTVNFENTVIVMTSNAGSDRSGSLMGFGRTAEQVSRDKAVKALEEFLRPEFMGRVDEVISFKPLDEESMTRIAGLMLNELKAVMQEKGIALTYTKPVCELLARQTVGGVRGARNLRGAVRRQVEDKVVDLLVANCDRTVSAVRLSVSDGAVKLDSTLA